MLIYDRFRFHTELNAPTAMVKRADEIPLTYLNKGTTYILTIRDTKPLQDFPIYRTSIRISFENDVQRQSPQTFWQLWKEGRGTNEAHHRGGRVQGAEFVALVPLNSSGYHIELQKTSLDGFSVIWYPTDQQRNPFLQPQEDGSREQPNCQVGIRFNFLSTDFNHYKGVKGVPVRLCAKTSLASDAEFPSNENQVASTETTRARGALERVLMTVEKQQPQICYCKIKLFRDLGAERKLSNDVAHVKKTIEKLQKMISEKEARLYQFKKRKREEGSHAAIMVSPSSDFEYNDTMLKEDKERLSALQAMFLSTRPASVLDLTGEETDDPDLHPVTLPGAEDRNKHQDDVSNEWGSSLSRAGSQSSRASSPPRASSMDWNRGHITPELIPFQNTSPPTTLPNVLLHPQVLRTGEEYAYSRIGYDQVRLLALVQGKRDDPVVCSLKILPIGRLEGSQLVYQALSYAWGQEPASEQILLGNIPPQNGNTVNDEELDTIVTRPFFVRPNLFAALKRLRVEKEDLWFWVGTLMTPCEVQS
jgi:hypothetical protein